jgi:very-short-patch-repair endonuclease
MRSVIDADDALRMLGPRAVLSHETAARLHGIPLLDDDATERVSVPRSRHGRGVKGWVVHRADVPEDDVDARKGLRCTSAVRTLMDLTRVLSHAAAVCAVDSALREAVVSLEELAPLGRTKGRGARRVRAAARACDPLSGSVLETLLRLALADAGLPRPRSQYRVMDHGHEVARVDFCWPEQRLVVEADGFAFHSSRDDFRRDRARMNELERLGWRVLRFTWDDVVKRPDHVAGLVRACLVPLAA